jgi:hypothetical protein
MQTLKLYLMVGLPSETDEDIDECVEFVSAALSKVIPIALGIAPFVSKRQHAPRRHALRGHRRGRGPARPAAQGPAGRADVRPTSARWAWVEWVLADYRADRRAGRAVYDAMTQAGRALRGLQAGLRGERGAGSARWFSRVGLDGAMRAVVDRVEASSTQSGGVKVRVELEGERVLLLGSEPPSVHGTARIAAAVAEAAFAAMAQLGPARERAGRDRLHRAVWWQLGERLLWAPAFVERELGVDPAHAATVNRAAMHGSLQALRRSAAEAPFVREALEAKNELVVRLRDRTTRALGSVMTPSWTVHIAAAALERRAEAHCFASLVEAVLYERLRDRLDEDWFRNPRSGEVLRAESALMRTGGALPWLIERTGAKDEREAIERGANALGARVSEAFARATR